MAEWQSWERKTYYSNANTNNVKISNALTTILNVVKIVSTIAATGVAIYGVYKVGKTIISYANQFESAMNNTFNNQFNDYIKTREKVAERYKRPEYHTYGSYFFDKPNNNDRLERIFGVSKLKRTNYVSVSDAEVIY